MGAVWSKAQSEVVEASLGIAAACGVRWASVAAHELAHFLVAQWLGYEASIHLGALTSLPPHVHVHGITSCARHAALVRHAGWVFSVLLAAALSLIVGALTTAPRLLLLPPVLAAWLTAMDAVTSDLLRREPHECKASRSGACKPRTCSSPCPAQLYWSWRAGLRFYCGNFGCLLLDTASACKVYPLLRKMVQITSMRGAQSAGIVTYSKRGIAKPALHKDPSSSKRGKAFKCAMRPMRARMDMGCAQLNRPISLSPFAADRSTRWLACAYALSTGSGRT